MRPSEYGPAVGMVTMSENKVRAVRHLLPDYDVIWVQPHEHIQEPVIAADLPHVRNRSALVAREKAVHDYLNLIAAVDDGGLMASTWLSLHRCPEERTYRKVNIGLHNDVVQNIPELGDYVLERPPTYSRWLDQALLQSNRVIWISAAHTGIRLDDGTREPFMHTVGVVTEAKTKPFTKNEIREFAKEVGVERMMDSAGGLPIQLCARLFDQTVPVRAYFYPDAFQDERTRIAEIPWSRIDADLLRQFATGAYRGPLRYLMERMSIRQ